MHAGMANPLASDYFPFSENIDHYTTGMSFWKDFEATT